MNRTLFHAGFLVLSLALGACAATMPPEPAAEPPRDILFIGNSFTYYNDSVHKHLRQLMRAAGIEPGVMRIMTISGSRLAEHEPALGAMLERADWDIVVLQGHSREPIEERESFHETVRRFHRVIERRGARTVLFMTWAYSDEPGMTAPLADGYNVIGRELGIAVVPVGLAMARAAAAHPGIRLLHDDKRHPTLAGTYLAAQVFHAFLFDADPGTGYTAGLDPATARALYRIARERQ